MVVNYNVLLAHFPERQDVLIELETIKGVTQRYDDKFVLTLTKESLCKGANTEFPLLSDIRITAMAAVLADDVIYFRQDGKEILLKGTCRCTGPSHRECCSEHSEIM